LPRSVAKSPRLKSSVPRACNNSRAAATHGRAESTLFSRSLPIVCNSSRRNSHSPSSAPTSASKYSWWARSHAARYLSAVKPPPLSERLFVARHFTKERRFESDRDGPCAERPDALAVPDASRHDDNAGTASRLNLSADALIKTAVQHERQVREIVVVGRQASARGVAHLRDAKVREFHRSDSSAKCAVFGRRCHR
jgi:hypothetical protein